MLRCAFVVMALGYVGVVSAQAPASKADAAMQGYYGNSLVLRDQAGAIIEIIYYRPDHTLRQWRDGVWIEGPWVINNGQDNSTLCKSRVADGQQMSWCHAFAPNKQVGDHWINPESKGGHPEVVGGITLVNVDGKWIVPKAPEDTPPPAEVWSLEKGLVSSPAKKQP